MVTNYLNTYLEEMAQTKSALTVKNHKSTLNKFLAAAKCVDPAEILARDVMNWKKELLANGKASSANTQLKRVKMFFNWLVKEGVLLESPAEDIKQTSEAEVLPKWITPQQRDKLIRAVKRDSIGSHLSDSKKSYRDYAIVMMMLQTGIRLNELLELKWEDVTLGDRKGRVLIRGKHGQQREVAIVSDLFSVLKAYRTFDGLKGKYVFYSQKSDKIGARTVQTMIKKYSEVVGEELTPHMLRHTFAHDLVSGGMQLEAVARVMGHIKRDGSPNIQQTIRYTKASQNEIDDSMESILAIG